MRTNAKAEAVNFGSKTNFTGGEIQAFSVFNHIENMPMIQCKNCELKETRIRQLEGLALSLAKAYDERRPL